MLMFLGNEYLYINPFKVSQSCQKIVHCFCLFFITQGATCSVDVNECQTIGGTVNECQNGGTCVNTAGGYRYEQQ